MPVAWFPNYSMTLVRTASAKMPRNTYVFRVDKKMTKLEIKEYLQKLYRVKVERVATINYMGKLRRIIFKGKVYKTKDYKKAYVRVADEKGGEVARNE